jgi:regulator of RNase E activity RraA
MNYDILELLRSVDTPTICNAIEVAQGKRGFDAFTRGTVISSAPTDSAIVGYAVTAKIAAVAPPTDAPDVIRARRMSYYKAMAYAPKPGIAVIEDIDGPDAIGAFWGEVNTTIHKGFGLSGTLTNGVMRDLGDMAPDYPVIAGSVGPSHGFVHVREIGTPVNVFEMNVKNGDLIHADRHGALVIPLDALSQLPSAIKKMQDTEKLILEPARGPDFDFEKFQAAWSAFEAART